MSHVDNPFQSPAILSFCPGVLGLERGLERAIGKIRVMAYVEIEAFIIANLVAGMEAGVVDPAPVWTDAKTFDASPFRGKIHGIIGGYPCPGESLAGLRQGHLYKGFIWPSIRRAIAATRPLWCYFENVDDHLTGTFPIVLRSLHNMGYRVEAGIFTAEEVGASHERERVFVLALADSYCLSASRRFGNLQGTSKTIEGEKQKWKRSRNDIRHSGKIIQEAELAHAGRSGLQRQKSGLVYGQGKGISGSTSKCRPQDFPLGQGAEQWDWEEPREIESGVGYTIERYNFEADILRANGNSVLEQTSELAFLTLLEKHGISIE